MKVCPLTSTSVAHVCWAIWDAISFASSSERALLSILHLAILFFSSCNAISLTNSVVAPLFPIQTVGFASHSCLITNLLFPAVSPGIFSTLSLPFQRYSHFFAAPRTCDYKVRFSFLPRSHATVYARQDKAFAVPTDLASVLGRQTDSG